jgi:AraC-like DNA-binding protein
LPSDRYRVLALAEELLESDHTSSTTNVGRLAALSGVSEVYFRRIFQSKYGVSPKEYLVRRRIAYAKELLSSGHFSVSEVAHLSGYSELCHFSREFKRRVCVSPTEFEK